MSSTSNPPNSPSGNTEHRTEIAKIVTSNLSPLGKVEALDMLATKRCIEELRAFKNTSGTANSLRAYALDRIATLKAQQGKKKS